MKKFVVSLLLTVACATHADNHDILTLDQLLSAFNWNFDEGVITTEKVTDGLYVLFGMGGNIAVSIGEDGVLLVDDMFPELMPKIYAAIKELGGDGIDFVINTHWHFDHAQGNLALGPDGSIIVAHSHSAEMVTKDNVVNLVMLKMLQEAYPKKAWPTISFEDSMSFHYNGGRIDVAHHGPAHTAGDAVVIFREHNAVHMGDVFNNTGYPFIDADNGGDISGMIDFCKIVLAEVGLDAVIIPGHGAIVDGKTMQAYIEMLETVRDRVLALMNDGMSLEEIDVAGVIEGFEEAYGDPQAAFGFVNRVYTSLSKK